MVKLAIFGDSFGIANHRRTDHNMCWVDLLKNKYQVDNFSVSGSSIFYSYQMFKQHYKKYDKCIFLVTIANRIWTSHIYKELEKIGESHLSHVNNLDLLKKHSEYLERFYSENRIINETFKTALNYYTYLQNAELDIFTAAGLLYEIKKLHPNLLLISTLPSYAKDKIHFNYLSSIVGHFGFLRDITLYENQSLGFDDWDSFDSFVVKQNLYDARHCHISDENNLVLGKEILKWLDTMKVNLDLTKFHSINDLKTFKNKYLLKEEND